MGNIDNISHFRLTLPFIDRENTIEWDRAGFEYTFKKKLLIGLVTYSICFLDSTYWFLVFYDKKVQGGASGVGGIFKFGKSRAALWTSDQPRVTFKDVAGCEEAKEKLKKSLTSSKSQRFQKLGAKVPQGALLVGPQVPEKRS